MSFDKYTYLSDHHSQDIEYFRFPQMSLMSLCNQSFSFLTPGKWRSNCFHYRLALSVLECSINEIMNYIYSLCPASFT